MQPDQSLVAPVYTPEPVETPVSAAQVYETIAGVLDPELDEPLVNLGFIDRVEVDGPDVTIVFKLPTYWCAPNFAYLMASDLRDCARQAPGVRSARVVLLDHCMEDEVTAGINAGRSFGEAFESETPEDADLEKLRRTFLRKGFLMRQDRLIRRMLKASLDEETITSLRVADLVVDEARGQAFVITPRGSIQLERAAREASGYLRRRQALGLPSEDDALLITDDAGRPVARGGLQDFLRRSRSVRLNIMFNTAMCKSLFRTRYENAGAEEAHREEGDDV